MTPAPLTTAAFDGLLATLAKIRDDYVNSEVRGHDELETVEGFGYVLQMVGHVSEFLIEADRERPRFSLIVSPARKILGDNPDSIYHQAAIRGDRAYRIKGRRTGQDYISFTVHGTDPTGGYGGPVLADINDDAPAVRRRRPLRDRAQRERAGRRRSRPCGSTLDPDARMVLVRNYFQHERLGAERPRDPRRARHRAARRSRAVAAARPTPRWPIASTTPPTMLEAITHRPARVRRAGNGAVRVERAELGRARRGASAPPVKRSPARSTSTTRAAASTSVPTTRW